MAVLCLAKFANNNLCDTNIISIIFSFHDTIDTAAENNDPKVLRLLDNPGIAIKSFTQACVWGYVEVVQVFLHRGVATTRGGLEAMNRSLRWAAREGHIEVVRLLLEHGADTKAKNMRALRWAVLHNRREIVQMLCDNIEVDATPLVTISLALQRSPKTLWVLISKDRLNVEMGRASQ
jgi:ankyrin repeat protein